MLNETNNILGELTATLGTLVKGVSTATKMTAITPHIVQMAMIVQIAITCFLFVVMRRNSRHIEILVEASVRM